jgi:hypothetical protein
MPICQYVIVIELDMTYDIKYVFLYIIYSPIRHTTTIIYISNIISLLPPLSYSMTYTYIHIHLSVRTCITVIDTIILHIHTKNAYIHLILTHRVCNPAPTGLPPTARSHHTHSKRHPTLCRKSLLLHPPILPFFLPIPQFSLPILPFSGGQNGSIILPASDCALFIGAAYTQRGWGWRQYWKQWEQWEQ